MRRILALLATTALMVAMLAMPASAQQTGLVNVDVDVTNNTLIVQVPIAIAANVCGIDVNVLVQKVQEDENFTREADAQSTADAIAELPPAFRPNQ